MLNMTETAEKLKLELSHLSIQERAEIASFLIHSLDENMDQDIRMLGMQSWLKERRKSIAAVHPANLQIKYLLIYVGNTRKIRHYP
jgi:hypothetical protein